MNENDFRVELKEEALNDLNLLVEFLKKDWVTKRVKVTYARRFRITFIILFAFLILVVGTTPVICLIVTACIFLVSFQRHVGCY